MREMKVPAEGVMTDLHVIRVSNRLGITHSENAEKIETDIMNSLPQELWANAGMALSFLGREICRPTDPLHHKCIMNKVCAFYKSIKSNI
jgi:endonuclease-3